MAHVTDFKEAGFDSVLEELEWRGLISQSTDRKQLAEALNGEPVTYYCGFDPTAASLHIGNLVQLINMRHLQAAGHHPIALVGGATGLIGDPRQSGERTLNPKDVVAGWAERLKRQIGGILETYGDNPVRFVSNYDWTAQMSVIDFLRDVGKNFRLGTMLAKDTVARRLNSEEGISFTEFSYQVLQGNDFLHLFDEYGCTLEIGGSDQWGNLTSGMDLIRKVRGVTVNVFTSPIITDATGKKFGKSEGNAVWLDAPCSARTGSTSSGSTAPMSRWKACSSVHVPAKGRDRTTRRRIAHQSRRTRSQRTLAWEVTSFVHGEAATQAAIDASAALFGRGGDLASIDEDTLEAAIDGLKIEDESGAKTFASVGIDDRITEAGVKAGLFKSISEARKTIKSGGVYLNNNRVTDEEQTLGQDDFLHGRFALIRRGKKALGVVEKH